ncbi:MAG: hypothetical protein ACTH58_04595 [Marinomonas foliarum]|jgi:hypothetical protein|uniref:Uncharacterized protein n=1 Tax=Marinomonas polaris DSM 16579 TaxID=1122206 RepID=A0A1M5J2C1_9GAMM|nr:hypothetical protein [Marinomonas polaris]MBU1293924.1 hypothetical protein [Gammaproteobacteria bacterium]MBU1466303.1 hypothetical protein [Gammaproteobacteria bacterium]MBU2021688.1 hypothetical protein [Gammaproteobacteria bacterium]MBU2240561.1 hypothetical protein [Gammaproteobacteria bacterium]MBU2320631.1 hypothetical protein [Gammaproteobacteria bacterium]|tara:strand:+ start:1691 stop:2467 length:777 start_codon:yes stop_codon:yes gene_type:complete
MKPSLLDLLDHPAKEKYMKHIHQLETVKVMFHAVKNAQDIDRSTSLHPDNDSYINLSTFIQIYFINSVALLDELKLTSTPHFQQTNTKGLSYIGRAIRNIVAHEGLLLPTHTQGGDREKGKFKFFGIPRKKVLKAILQLSLKDQKILYSRSINHIDNIESAEHFREQVTTETKNIGLFLDEALDIISNEFNNDIIRIVNVMTKHFTNIVPHILDALIQKEKEKDLSEYSKIRSRHSFSTISTKVAEYKNLIEEIKMLN